MRPLGVLLIAAGALVAGYFVLLYDTKKSVGGSLAGAEFELSVADKERESTRNSGLMVGLGAVVAGGIITALSGRKH